MGQAEPDDLAALRAALERDFPRTEGGLMTLAELAEVLMREDDALHLRLCPPHDPRNRLADAVDALLAQMGDTERVRRGFAKHHGGGAVQHRRWAVRGRAQVWPGE